MLSHKVEERTAAARLTLWLNPYRDNIFANSIHRQGRLVEDLMSDWEDSLEVKQATALLNLDELLEEIVKVNARIRRNYLKRLKEKETLNVNGAAIRDAAYKDLRVLVTIIEASYSMAANDKEREELVQLSSKINGHLKDFRTQLRSCTTKRKNKKDVEKAVKELINDSLQESQNEENIKAISITDDNQLSSSVSLGGDVLTSSRSYKINGAEEDVRDDKNNNLWENKGNGKEIMPPD